MICPGCGETVYLDIVRGLCSMCYARDLRARHRHKQRRCKTCGTPFTTTRSDARFCSNACRQKAHRRSRSRLALPAPP
jgi:hypothetical protein